MTPLRLGGDVRDDDDTPSNGHGPPRQRPQTRVDGGDVARRIEAGDLRVSAYVDEVATGIKDEFKADLAAVEDRLGVRLDAQDAKLDALLEAHKKSVLRLFVEKAVNPISGTLLLSIPLVVVLWWTGLPFEGPGYRIGTFGKAAAANADSDEDQGDMPASVSGAGVEPQPEP